MMHTQAVLEATRKASSEMPIRMAIIELEIALSCVIGISEHKSCTKQVYKKYNLH